jgi:hypothetical protein
MKKLIIGSVIVLTILLLSGLATPVSAGVEPSPFRDEVNKLGSIVNQLDSIGQRVEHAGVVPPNDQKPGTLRGTLNRLDAMGGDLERMDSRLGGLIGEFPNNPQDLPEDVIAALGEVKSEAQGIVDSINEYLRDPTNGDPPKVLTIALVGVLANAQQMVGRVNNYLIGEIIG